MLTMMLFDLYTHVCTLFLICSSVKTLLLERANVRCIQTGEEKPVGAVNCKVFIRFEKELYTCMS